MSKKDLSPPAPGTDRAQAPDSDRLRNLLVASGLSPSEGARALGVDEKTLLYWCQPNGKILPPRWALQMLSRLVALKQKAGHK
jgi:hypothetical protein